MCFSTASIFFITVLLAWQKLVFAGSGTAASLAELLPRKSWIVCTWRSVCSVIFVHATSRSLFLQLFFSNAGGLEQEGLFQVNGNAETVEWLRQRYDNGEDVDLVKEADVPSAISLLRFFLQELPEPVIPGSLHTHLMQLSQGSSYFWLGVLNWWRVKTSIKFCSDIEVSLECYVILCVGEGSIPFLSTKPK